MGKEYIDLTLPVKPHWRWTFHKSNVLDYKSGGPLLDEIVYWDIHSFTHMDPPLHMIEGEIPIDQVPLSAVIGEAKIVDITGLEDCEEITGDLLEKAGDHVGEGDIVILKTCQGQKYDWETSEFWNKSPYMVESAGQWLIDRKVKTVGFDFPQDYVIRELFGGKIPKPDDFLMHKMLLGAGMNMVEYITNMHLIETKTVEFYAVPLKLEGIAGSPARVFAVR